MALTPHHELTVDEDDLAPLEHEVAALAGDADGGWINLVPDVEEGHEAPSRSALAAIFSARGDAVPFATWTAPDRPDGRSSLGIQHGSGPQALARLREAGLDLPAGWQRAGDHPRRGLVVTAPADAEAEEVVWWLLTAAHALSTVPLQGVWRANVYRSSAPKG